MFSIFSAIGAVFSFFGTALKALMGLFIYRAGEKAQAAKDSAATAKIIEAERDAADTAPSAEDAAREGKF